MRVQVCIGSKHGTCCWLFCPLLFYDNQVSCGLVDGAARIGTTLHSLHILLWLVPWADCTLSPYCYITAVSVPDGMFTTDRSVHLHMLENGGHPKQPISSVVAFWRKRGEKLKEPGRLHRGCTTQLSEAQLYFGDVQCSI